MKSSIAHHSSLAICKRIMSTQLMEKCSSKRMTVCQKVMEITVKIKRKLKNTTRRIQRFKKRLPRQIICWITHYLAILLVSATIRKTLQLDKGNCDMLNVVVTWIQIQLALQIKVVLYLKLFPVSYLTSTMRDILSYQIRNVSQLAIFSDKTFFSFLSSS